MSNATHGRTVEDIGLGMLRTEGGVTGVIESGYAYPSGVRNGDHFFRVIGTRAMIFQQYGKEGEPLIEVHTTEGVQFSEDLSHGERMKTVVDQALTALAAGRSFTPNIDQAVRILEIQDAVYDRARRNPLTNGPHPHGQEYLMKRCRDLDRWLCGRQEGPSVEGFSRARRYYGDRRGDGEDLLDLQDVFCRWIWA